MTKKTAKMVPEEVNELAQDKPVVYKILNKKGENIYTGSAKRGRVADRLLEHLEGKDKVPGAAKVKIEQHPTIDAAKKSEERIIRRNKPKHNKAGK